MKRPSSFLLDLTEAPLEEADTRGRGGADLQGGCVEEPHGATARAARRAPCASDLPLVRCSSGILLEWAAAAPTLTHGRRQTSVTFMRLTAALRGVRPRARLPAPGAAMIWTNQRQRGSRAAENRLSSTCFACGRQRRRGVAVAFAFVVRGAACVASCCCCYACLRGVGMCECPRGAR